MWTRIGEVTALQRKDLRMEENQLVVSVYKAWKQMPTGMKIGAQKTKASVRDVSLPEKFSLQNCLTSLIHHKHGSNLLGNYSRK